MKNARAVIRILAILSMTLCIYVVWILGLAVFVGSPRGRIRVRRRIVRTWSLSLAYILGMRLETSGQPPEPPFCLVANHLSYIDALAIHMSVYGVMISKADVRNWPLIGHLSWLSGTLFINRSIARDVVRINALIQRSLERGDGVIFFPEGTSTRGLDVGTFRSPLLAFPAEQDMPVHYASISYRTDPPDPPASTSICYWGDMTFAKHLYELLTIRRFKTLLHFGDQPVVHPDRKDLARILRENIEANFQPVLQESA